MNTPAETTSPTTPTSASTPIPNTAPNPMEPTSPTQPPPASANPPGSAGIPAGDSELKILTQPEAPKNQPLTISPFIGKIDKLTEIEQIRYMGCEAVLSMGW